MITRRSLLMGLPQGSVLSPTLLNVVMARVIPSVICDPLPGMCTTYANDFSIWSTGASAPVITMNLQTLLDKLIEGLGEVGLAIVAEKSRYILFPGKGRRTRSAALDVKGTPIHSTKEHRFLVAVVDGRNNGVARVKSVLAAIKGRATAIWRLCGTRCGSLSSALLHLHKVLVVS